MVEMKDSKIPSDGYYIHAYFELVVPMARKAFSIQLYKK